MSSDDDYQYNKKLKLLVWHEHL